MTAAEKIPHKGFVRNGVFQLRLTDQLCCLAEIWAKTNDRSEATLGSKVAGDSKLFDRLREGSTCTIATVEKLLTFFRNKESWSDESIPEVAVNLLDGLDNIPTDSLLSTGQNSKTSSEVVA